MLQSHFPIPDDTQIHLVHLPFPTYEEPSKKEKNSQSQPGKNEKELCP